MKKNKDRIVIIGSGKVGTAIGYLLRSAGYSICGVYDQSIQAAQTAIPYTGGRVCTIQELADIKADGIFITTVDDAIAAVCKSLVQERAINPGSKVIHMSGAGSIELIGSARSQGAFVASIHPVQSFADTENAISRIPGSLFGITADNEIKNWSVKLVEDLGGIPFFVDESDKPLYHAAACMASNYLTTLLFMVIDIYKTLGLTQDNAIKAFQPLVRGTLSNIENKGAVQALTGPIARGDIGTIEKHLKILHEKLPQYLKVYCELGIITIDVGLLKGSIDNAKAEDISKLLKGEGKK